MKSKYAILCLIVSFSVLQIQDISAAEFGSESDWKEIATPSPKQGILGVKVKINGSSFTEPGVAAAVVEAVAMEPIPDGKTNQSLLSQAVTKANKELGIGTARGGQSSIGPKVPFLTMWKLMTNQGLTPLRSIVVNTSEKTLIVEVGPGSTTAFKLFTLPEQTWNKFSKRVRDNIQKQMTAAISPFKSIKTTPRVRTQHRQKPTSSVVAKKQSKRRKK